MKKTTKAACATSLIAAALLITPISANATPSTTDGDGVTGATWSPPVDVIVDDGSAVITTEQSELIIHPATGPEPSDAQLADMAASITCSLNVQNVHASSHVSGTINGVAVVSCTGAAGSLALHYSLIRTSPNYTQWGAGSKSNIGQSSLQNNRAVSCSEGPANFRGWAQGEITPPPGYTLEGSPTHSAYGPITGVACGVFLGDENSAPSNGETISITFVRSDLTG